MNKIDFQEQCYIWPLIILLRNKVYFRFRKITKSYFNFLYLLIKLCFFLNYFLNVTPTYSFSLLGICRICFFWFKIRKWFWNIVKISLFAAVNKWLPVIIMMITRCLPFITDYYRLRLVWLEYSKMKWNSMVLLYQLW